MELADKIRAMKDDLKCGEYNAPIATGIEMAAQLVERCEAEKEKEEDPVCAKLAFTCPKCGGCVIEQVASDCTVSTRVTEVTDVVDYANDTEVDSEGDVRYQCSGCGWVIPDVGNDDDLIEWLQDNNEKGE